MGNAIKRTGSGFISKESAFLSGGSTFFYLPIVTITEAPVINYALNQAAAGNSYSTNDARPDTGWTDITLEFKIREEVLPLLLLNKYTITSTPVSGDTDVIEHVCAYDGRNVGTSFDFIFRYPSISDESYRGFIPRTMSWVVESPGYLRINMVGRANLPVPTIAAPTITASPEFVSRNFIYEQSIGVASLDAYDLTAFSANFEYGTPEDTDEIPLGSAQRKLGVTGEDLFTLQATALMPDYSLRDAYISGEAFATVFGCEDTTRIIPGSITNIHPSIRIEIPYSKCTGWSEPNDLSQMRKQQFTLTSLDGVGYANAPHRIVVRNNIVSY